MIRKNVDLIAIGFLLIVFGIFSHARRVVSLEVLPSRTVVVPGSFRPPVPPVPPSLHILQD